MINNYILSVLIITLIILIIYYIYYIYTMYTDVSLEQSHNAKHKHLYYMSYEEIIMFLEKDEDMYVANLSPIDLYARKVSSSAEYIEIIKKEVTHFNKGDKLILDKCTKKADELLRNVDIKNISKESNLDYSKYLNYKDIANIKWVLAITRDNRDSTESSSGLSKYEEGLPHTRKNIIFLSQNLLNYSEDEIIKILIHEKIHIYQRYNEGLFKTIIYNMGYTDIPDISPDKRKYIRSNPDVNSNIYKNINTGKLMICLYSNDKPYGINDIILQNFSMEHPYEKIAYEISEYIYNVDKIEKYKDI